MRKTSIKTEIVNVQYIWSDFKRQIFIVMQNTYFVPAYGQRHCSVEVFPSIIHWLSVSKDLSFKVLDHMLHNFTEDNRRWITTMPRHLQSIIYRENQQSEPTDWPSWDIFQAWCLYHNDRPPIWGFPSQRSWPEALLPCPWCQSLAVMVDWKHIPAMGKMEGLKEENWNSLLGWQCENRRGSLKAIQQTGLQNK